MRWPGFRKVRGQVCTRIARRMEELGLDDVEAYRRRLEARPREWDVLDGFCRITISRFRRDRQVWEHLRTRLLPVLLERLEGSVFRVWSAGCGSGEEPYTLAVAWRLFLQEAFPRVRLEILATDAEPAVLERAREGRYDPGTLKELPDEWVEAAFVERGEELVLQAAFREPVDLRRQDVRKEMPPGPFHLIFCRNLVFTYFARELQARVLEGLLERLAPGGLLVLGGQEELPPGDWPLERPHPSHPVYRRSSTSTSSAPQGQ